uniref:Uncharacterized protein n=1 Tax=Solanum lycopersicum TaxID=4081 RepID=A0A3Q7FVF2_SOLLC
MFLSHRHRSPGYGGLLGQRLEKCVGLGSMAGSVAVTHLREMQRRGIIRFSSSNEGSSVGASVLRPPLNLILHAQLSHLMESSVVSFLLDCKTSIAIHRPSKTSERLLTRWFPPSLFSRPMLAKHLTLSLLTSCSHNLRLKCFQKWIGQGMDTRVKWRSQISRQMINQSTTNRLGIGDCIKVMLLQGLPQVACPQKITLTTRLLGKEQLYKRDGIDIASSERIFVTLSPIF